MQDAFVTSESGSDTSNTASPAHSRHHAAKHRAPNTCRLTHAAHDPSNTDPPGVCVRAYACVCVCMCLTVVGSAMLRRRTHTRRSSHSRAAHPSHCTRVLGVMGMRLTAPGAGGGSPSRCVSYVRQQGGADSVRHDILVPAPAEQRRSHGLCHWGGPTSPSARLLACPQSVALGGGRACRWQRSHGG